MVHEHEIIDVQCNNICVAVIKAHGMTVSSVISVYTMHNDTHTEYKNVHVPLILVQNIIVIWCSRMFVYRCQYQGDMNLRQLIIILL